MTESVALDRIGVHQHYIDVLINCYKTTKFYAEDEYGSSKTKVQSSGIRQGCPLSPYLLVLVMSVIDHDISRSIAGRTHNARFEGLEFDRVYYAYPGYGHKA